jgi:hypothetical protein
MWFLTLFPDPTDSPPFRRLHTPHQSSRFEGPYDLPGTLSILKEPWSGKAELLIEILSSSVIVACNCSGEVVWRYEKL